MEIQGGTGQLVELSYEGDAPSNAVSISLADDPSQYEALAVLGAPQPDRFLFAWIVDVYVRTTTGKFFVGRHFEQPPAFAFAGASGPRLDVPIPNLLTFKALSAVPHSRVICTAYCPGAVQWYARISGDLMPSTLVASVEMSARDCCAGWGVQRVRYLDHPYTSKTVTGIGAVLVLPWNFRRTRAIITNTEPPAGPNLNVQIGANAALPFAVVTPGQTLVLRGPECVFTASLNTNWAVVEESDG